MSTLYNLNDKEFIILAFGLGPGSYLLFMIICSAFKLIKISIVILCVNI